MDSVNNVSDSFTETTIDFSTYTVIAVFDEVRPSSAYSLEVGVFQDVSNSIVDVIYISFGEMHLPWSGNLSISLRLKTVIYLSFFNSTKQL